MAYIPAPSYSACTACATLDVPTLCMCQVSTHTTYVPVPVLQCHMWYCIQTVCIPHLLFGTHTVHANIQYMRTYRHVHAKPDNTNQAKRQKQLLNTPIGRQAGSQHVFITGFVILPKVNKWTVTLPTVT